MKKKLNIIFNSKVWRSVFRYGIPDTERSRSAVVFHNFFLHLHPTRVRKRSIEYTYTWGLGGLSLGLFIYYRVSVPAAYQDMKDLQFVVSYGRFLRNMHRWAAHSMVLVVFLHMLRVFYTNSFRKPKEFNWVVGVILLILTLLLSFTGYLLPWDQLSFWAITVATNMVRSIPFGIGDKIAFILLGGNIVYENSLVRFYVMHCFILPVIIVIMMGVHFWRVRKDGGV